MNKRILLICALVLYILFIAPVFFHWTDEIRACALLLIMQILWLGRVFPLAYSSVLLMLMMAFHFMDYSKVLGFVASPVVWLLFSTYLLAGAFKESGWNSRLALRILYWSRGDGRKIVAASFFLISILSIMIPSNIGRGNLVTSVLDKLIANIRGVKEITRLPKALFIGICYLTAMTGALIATGASSTIYTFGFINDHLDHPLTYLQWMIFTVPPILLFMLLLWIFLNLFFPFEKINPEFVASYIDEELVKVGRVKKAEVKIVIIISGTVLLWVLQPFHHFSIPLIGLLGAAATVFPGIGIWDWKEARQKINWDTILFFASTLMLSNVLISSGLLKWIANRIVPFADNGQVLWLLLMFIVFIFIIRLFFVNVLGVMAFIIPLSFSIGEQLPGFSPVLFPLTFFLAGVPGFFFITQSPVHIISFSYGYFSEKDLMKTGLATSLIWLVILLATAFFYWDRVLLS